MSQHNSAYPNCCVTFRGAGAHGGCSDRRHKSSQSNSHLAQRVWGKLANSQNATPHFILVSFQPTKAHLVRVAHAHAVHPFPVNHFAREFVLSSSGEMSAITSFSSSSRSISRSCSSSALGCPYASLKSAMPRTMSQFSLDRPAGFAQIDWPTGSN